MKEVILNILKEESVYGNVMEVSFDEVADNIIKALKEKGAQIEEPYMAWWKGLGKNQLTSMLQQSEFCKKYYGQFKKTSSLTKEEIKKMYEAEMVETYLS